MVKWNHLTEIPLNGNVPLDKVYYFEHVVYNLELVI